MQLLTPIRLLAFAVVRFIRSGLNDKSIFGLVLNFCINFAPVFIWLLIFKNAGIIPHLWRPEIHVNLANTVDHFMFNTIIGSVLTLMFSLSMSVLLYLHFYRGNTDPKESGNYVELSTLEANPINIVDNGIDDDIQSQGSGKIGSDREESNEFFSSDFEIDEEELKDSERLQPDKIIVNFPISSQASTQYHKRNFFPLNNWNLAVPLLLATSWIILNIDHYFSEPIYTEKDLVSWFSYVILHFCAPLFTAIWLYAFHPQGALKLFGMSLGLQNILGVLTHLAFPNAPPWFIHVYGPDHEANYEMEGYAAGLIRVDTAMGTHLHTNGFHKSPIVFGALPSLHSAMAVCVFFHLAYYSRWTVIKALGLLFVVVQWWATIYLDHHWRLDLYAGLLYAIGLFTLFTSMRAKVDERFFMLDLQVTLSVALLWVCVCSRIPDYKISLTHSCNIL